MPASIALVVPRVRCVDETNPEFWGNDEMELGAVYVCISANLTFDVRVVHTRSVGGNFDDNETVNFNRRDSRLLGFGLGDPVLAPYPKVVLAQLVLAEHDAGNGGNDLIDTLAEEFRKALTKAALDDIVKDVTASVAGSSASGGLLVGTRDAVVRDHRRSTGGATLVRDHRGSASPAPTGNSATTFVKSPTLEQLDQSDELTKAFVAEAGKRSAGILEQLARKLLGKASAWAGDDIFPPVLRQLDIDAEPQPGGRAIEKPAEVAEFTGHGGRYHVTTNWRLVPARR